MQFLKQPIEFKALPDHAALTCAARVNTRELMAFCRAAHDAERRLVALWGSDERDRDAKYGFALHVAFDLVEGLVCLTLPLPTDDPVFPDLSLPFPAAERMQRAARDLLGISPDAGDLRPWLRHDNWPVDYFPLRRDTPDKQFETKNEDYAFVRVEGDGVHEIAVGPIHAGIIEPGHFRFSAMGESVRQAEITDAIRVRRDGRFILHDAIRLHGDVGAILARPAVARGARAVATLVMVAPDVDALLAPVREVLADAPAETGASSWDGMLVVRALAESGDALRQTMIAALAVLRQGRALPRVWMC